MQESNDHELLLSLQREVKALKMSGLGNWRGGGDSLVGSVRLWFGRDEEPPRGYLFLEGQTLKIAEYPRLFEVFGFEYGGSEEDGEFKLPDPRDYFLRVFNPDGEREVGDTQKGGVPNVTGEFEAFAWSNGSPTGSVTSNIVNGNCVARGTTANANHVRFASNASRNSSVYQSGLTEVRPNNMTVRLIIKATYEENSPEGFADKLYPVGSLFLSLEDSEICPIEMLGVGKWELVESDRVLQTSSDTHNPGELIAAGLPNITGTLTEVKKRPSGTSSGATLYQNSASGGGFSSTAANVQADVSLNASRSNSVYGKSSTVQPPALVVKVWKRVS